MNKWGYNVIDHTAYFIPVGGPSEDSLDEMLNSFGKDGWELICVLESIWFIFKRKVA